MKKDMHKSHILTVMKKELRRFFGDKRMLVGVLLPGIMIYLLYSLMGDILIDNLIADEDTVYTVQTEHMPASMENLWTGMGVQVNEISYATVEEGKAAVSAQELHLYVVFPENFEELVRAYDPASGEPAPLVEIYYNSASTESANMYNLMTESLNAYESTMANRFDINIATDTEYDMATPEDMTGMMFSMMMPMLVVTLLFSSCMALAPESIAGEKERGTIATLLVTPIRRSELALGKIFSLSIVSLLSGLWSFLAILMSLPKLMGGEAMGAVDATIYGVSDYAWILGIILSSTLLFVSMISVISAFAKSVKEASGLVTPLMILVMIVSLSGMMSQGAVPALPMFLIPVYNVSQCIGGVFGGTYEPMQMVLTIASNLVLTGLMVILLTKMFNSEKVMFNS